MNAKVALPLKRGHRELRLLYASGMLLKDRVEVAEGRTMYNGKRCCVDV